ncbi:MAG: hypothetical protein ACYC09_13975 [Bacteroidota bacterium]
MQPQNRKISALMNEVKEVMRQAFVESELTEEELADQASVTQPTINRWFSYKLEYFPPLFILGLLPKSITVPICSYFVHRHGLTVVEQEFNLPTDGRVEDNLLNIDQFQGEVIKLMKKDPKKAMAYCDSLIREAMIAKKELEEQQSK